MFEMTHLCSWQELSYTRPFKLLQNSTYIFTLDDTYSHAQTVHSKYFNIIRHTEVTTLTDVMLVTYLT